MKILIAHNGAVSYEAAIEDLCRAGLPATAKVFLLHTAEPLSSSNDLGEDAFKCIRSRFPQWEIFTESLSGSPSEAILSASSWWRPDLLVIASDTFATERSMSRNVSLEVAHRAKCSVRLVKPAVGFSEGPIHLAIGNSGSKECETIIDEVAGRQWPENTEAHVISISERQPSCFSYDGIDRLRNAGLKVNRTVIEGDPHQDLLREAARCNASTIFVGPRCRNEQQRFLLGSVTTAVMTRAHSTVEVVRR